MHQNQVDRYCFLKGSTKLVLFDDREQSPTRGTLNIHYFSEINRSIVSVPAGIWYAVENIGTSECFQFNFPSEMYNCQKPGKLILPLNNKRIPYAEFQCDIA